MQPTTKVKHITTHQHKPHHPRSTQKQAPITPGASDERSKSLSPKSKLETQIKKSLNIEDFKMKEQKEEFHGKKHQYIKEKKIPIKQLEKLTEKENGREPAILLPEYQRISPQLLKITMGIMSEKGADYRYFRISKNPVGADRGIRTSTIEVYPEEKIGSHIRPKSEELIKQKNQQYITDISAECDAYFQKVLSSHQE